MHFTNDVESATNVLGASWFGFVRIVGDGISVVVPSLLVHRQDEAITLACGRKKAPERENKDRFGNSQNKCVG